MPDLSSSIAPVPGRRDLFRLMNGSRYDLFFINPHPSSLLASIAAAASGQRVLVAFTGDASLASGDNPDSQLSLQFVHVSSGCEALKKIASQIVRDAEPSGCVIDQRRFYAAGSLSLSLAHATVVTHVLADGRDGSWELHDLLGTTSAVSFTALRVIDDRETQIALRPCMGFMSTLSCSSPPKLTAASPDLLAVELPCHSGVVYLPDYVSGAQDQSASARAELRKLFPETRETRQPRLCPTVPWYSVVWRAQKLAYSLVGSPVLVTLAGSTDGISETDAQQWVEEWNQVSGIGGDILYRWYWKLGKAVSEHLINLVGSNPALARRLIMSTPVIAGEIVWSVAYESAATDLDAVLRTGVCQSNSPEDCYAIASQIRETWPTPFTHVAVSDEDMMRVFRTLR